MRSTGTTGAVARRTRARFAWAVLLGVVLLGTGALAAACGGGSPGRQGVAALGTTATTTGRRVAAPSGNPASPFTTAFAFAQCMRTHGEPGFPNPTVSQNDGHLSASEVITPGSGVDPNSPQFAGAASACKHLLPRQGVPSAGPTLTPADRADYVSAAACMRSHDIREFPDPTFHNGSVTFNSQTPIETNTPQYQSALTTCQRLIPAGLPYSSSVSP